jgi:TetR/AcrR family transcriptional repressor of mexJK operon
MMMRLGRPRKGEEGIRREQLLEHAVRLFAEHGYGSVSLETIAREARVSLRTIYRQFGGKAELFCAVVRHFSDLFVAALPAEGDGAATLEETLVEFGREYLFRLTRPDLIRLRSQFLAEARRFPDLAAELYAQGPERTLRRLAGFFAAHQRAGRIAPGDPLFLAGQFIHCLQGEPYHRLQLGLKPTPGEAELESWVRGAVGLFLTGAGMRRGC